MRLDRSHAGCGNIDGCKDVRFERVLVGVDFRVVAARADRRRRFPAHEGGVAANQITTEIEGQNKGANFALCTRLRGRNRKKGLGFVVCGKRVFFSRKASFLAQAKPKRGQPLKNLRSAAHVLTLAAEVFHALLGRRLRDARRCVINLQRAATVRRRTMRRGVGQHTVKQGPAVRRERRNDGAAPALHRPATRRADRVHRRRA